MDIVNYILDNYLAIKKYLSDKVVIWILNHKSRKSDELVRTLRLYIHLLKNIKSNKIDISLNSLNEPIYSPHSNIKADLDDIIKFSTGLAKSNHALLVSSSFLTENNKTISVHKYFLDKDGKWLEIDILLEKLIKYSESIVNTYEEILSNNDYESNYKYNIVKKFLNELEPMLKSLSSMK